jgi:phosphoglycolate phosphatase-like HAD superfamily hydrolase
VRLLLFDIDGTLILTGGAGSRAMTRAFAATHGLDNALQSVDLAGRTDRIIMREALSQAGHAVDVDAAALDRFREAYCAALREEITQEGTGRRGLLPGVRPLLEALAGRDDVRLALLTGNFRASAEIKLAAFDVWRYFSWGAFADDAIERDELIAVAHARHETEHGHVIEPDAVVVIGDTPHDIRCARAGGAKAVAVATGTYDMASLERHQPDALFPDLTDTDAVLAALLD